MIHADTMATEEIYCESRLKGMRRMCEIFTKKFLVVFMNLGLIFLIKCTIIETY